METKEQKALRRFDVFSIHEYTHERQIKNHWTNMGVAFENADGSWNLRLRALPLVNPKTGLAELHMREPRPRSDTVQQGGDENGFVYNPDHSTTKNLI